MRTLPSTIFVSSLSAPVSPAAPAKEAIPFSSKPASKKSSTVQPKGSQAKPCQMRQVRELLLKYQLEID